MDISVEATWNSLMRFSYLSPHSLLIKFKLISYNDKLLWTVNTCLATPKGNLINCCSNIDHPVSLDLKLLNQKFVNPAQKYFLTNDKIYGQYAREQP